VVVSVKDAGAVAAAAAAAGLAREVSEMILREVGEKNPREFALVFSVEHFVSLLEIKEVRLPPLVLPLTSPSLCFLGLKVFLIVCKGEGYSKDVKDFGSCAAVCVHHCQLG